MDYDVVIIGSGLLGAVCAHDLAKRGMQVLMLEAGLPTSHIVSN